MNDLAQTGVKVLLTQWRLEQNMLAPAHHQRGRENMRTKAIISAAAMGVTLGISAVGPAQAALSQCTGTLMCIWGNNDFAYALASKGDGQTLSRLYGGDDNEMDSWANRAPGNASGFDDPTPDGTNDGCMTFAAVSNDNNVAPWNSDILSSWRTNRGC